MKRILVVAENAEAADELSLELGQQGFTCLRAGTAAIDVEMAKREAPDMILVDAAGLSASSWYSLKSEQLPVIKSALGLPVIALMPSGILDGVDSNLDIDDFIVRPFPASELIARIKRIFHRINKDSEQHIVKSGDLLIDIDKCEVSVNGRPIVLTFKEYELLKFLLRHKGNVCTREALLNEVWGYDYYGGDRTVDVHIRRLRSKIEDADHTFIETIRNIGYKFID
jgi:two-component system alkaline phosphatase synthesis response regulator PhoP